MALCESHGRNIYRNLINIILFEMHQQQKIAEGYQPAGGITAKSIMTVI